MNILGVCHPLFSTAFGVGRREKLQAWTYAATSRDCTRLCLDSPIEPYSVARSERENPPTAPPSPLRAPFLFSRHPFVSRPRGRELQPRKRLKKKASAPNPLSCRRPKAAGAVKDGKGAAAASLAAGGKRTRRRRKTPPSTDGGGA